MKYIFIHIFLILTGCLYSQNLVPNYSFEVYDTCPCSLSLLSYAIPWNTPTEGTPDYYNACCDGYDSDPVGVPYNFVGNHYAKQGVAYAGFIPYIDSTSNYETAVTDYYEYIQAPLISPLIANKKYCVEFYLAISNISQYAITEIGAYFSDTPVKNQTIFTNLPYQPQIQSPAGVFLKDTAWTLISGSFIAKGGESYITIGNFKYNNQTDTLKMGPPLNDLPLESAYYFIDVISVYQGISVTSAHSDAICIGTSDTLTATGSTTTYNWSPAIGLNNTTSATVIATPTVTTTYTVTSTTICGYDTALYTVTVNQIPVVSVNSATICNGTSATLTANGASSYLWDGVSINTTATITVNPTITTTYIVTPNNGGCFGIPMNTIVTVNPLPDITVNSPTICIDSSATLTAGGANTYSWLPATGLSATIGATTILTINSITATTTYTVTGTDINGCVDSSVSRITITTPPLITVNTATICPGFSTTLTAHSSNSNTYSWSPATGLNTTTGTSVIATPTITPTTYTVTGTNNCGTSSVKSTVIIYSPPIVIVNSATVCKGASTTLIAAGANTYNWSPQSGLNSSTGTTNIATPLLTTTYTVIGTDTNGCFDSTTTIVIVNPSPFTTDILPNIFTPNGDNINDVFLINTKNDDTYNINIYNIWGNEVFQSSNPNISWDGQTKDGKEATDGVYFYVIHSTCGSDNYDKHGFVQLIR